MIYFPIEIHSEEIFVRYLTKRDLKKGKIRYNDVFLDTRYPCVSIQRMIFCDENCCRYYSQKFELIGFLFFNVQNFQECISEYDEIEADLKDVLGRCDIVIHAEPCGHEEEVLIVD